MDEEWRELRLGVVGTGRLGSSLARAIARVGGRLVGVANRDAARASELAEELGLSRCDDAADLVDHCDLILLTVPDREIEAAASQLSFRADQFVVHCSGARTLGALASVGRVGAIAGCFHPLQAFSSASLGIVAFRGIACGIEAPEPLAGYLSDLAEALGARPFSLAGVDRARCHAAAVFASNSLVALASAAYASWASARLPAELAPIALQPLMRGALDSLTDLPPSRGLDHALTGPIARGDVPTVLEHLSALDEMPKLRDLYQCLARVLLDLDLEHTQPIHDALAAAVGDDG